MRYQADPERRAVLTAMEAEIARAREAEGLGGWITYLVRDPTRPDLRGNQAGFPIYVGQTKEFAIRVRNRFAKCEKYSTKADSVERRVADLLHRGVVVRYEVLDRQPTRLASLVSETNWARKCRARGYNIANKLQLQNEAGPPISRADIPHSWLWSFSLQEALEDGFRCRLGCIACGGTLELELTAFEQLDEPPAALTDIRNDAMWRKEPCTLCGNRQSRFVSLLVP